MAAAPLIREQFREWFGGAPEVVASAPGRVNLMGEHTDYNEGFVLPMAIDRRVSVAMARRSDRQFDVRSTVTADATPYVEAVARLMRERTSVPGANVLVVSDLPVASGLSSSAALELSVARALSALVETSWHPIEMAQLAQSAEHSIGVQCGIMDQIAATAGRLGHALLLDCRSLDLSYVSLSTGIAFVVMDTGMRRKLAESQFNQRRASCAAGVAAIQLHSPQVRALRDVTPEMLDAVAASLDPEIARRVRHVVLENSRPLAMARALSSGDFVAAGGLMDESHASLRDLYEVSSVHLDVICEVARAHPHCYGARMTGAGFGGCAIALVDARSVHDFIAVVQPRYEARTYKRSDFFAVSASDGARLE